MKNANIVIFRGWGEMDGRGGVDWARAPCTHGLKRQPTWGATSTPRLPFGVYSLLRLLTFITLHVWSFLSGCAFFFFKLEFSISDIKHPHKNISLYCFEH